MRRTLAATALCLGLAIASSSRLALAADDSTPAAATPAPAPAADDPDRAAAKVSVTHIRELGSALYHWSLDHAKPGEAKAEEPPVRWSSCPPLSLDEAASLLVPKYIAELPRTDGWGHALEVCLDRQRVQAGAHLVMGVRGPGRDGRFDGDEYAVGAFDPPQYDHDVVWFDGYFMAWPQRK